MKSQWFPWLPIMQFRRMGVFWDSNEQFGTHEKLSPTSTIYVNCMIYDPIDVIYNFTLSKALLIHIYIVSIWCMTPFTIHLVSNICLYIILEVSKVAKIRNRYNQVPHLTQDTNGKVTNSQKTPQTRAKRSALSQQVTTKHI